MIQFCLTKYPYPQICSFVATVQNVLFLYNASQDCKMAGYGHGSTELCKIIPAKFGEFLPIFPKMADGQEEAGLSTLAALRRENSNMQESF